MKLYFYCPSLPRDCGTGEGGGQHWYSHSLSSDSETVFIRSTDLDSFAARLSPWLGFKSRRSANKSRGCLVEEGKGWGRGRDAECDVAAFSVLFPRKMAILCTSKSPVDWIAMKWSHGNLQIGSASVPSPSWNPSHHALLQIPTASLPISTESPISLRGISLPINFLLYSV